MYDMEELSIEITYKCPMECLHCSSSAGNKNETFIPKEKILEMIDRCVEHCGTTEVSLSGGEPFEHPDFWEILEYIKKKGLKSIVYSCGIQQREFFPTGKESEYSAYSWERIFKLRNLCDKLIISLHGTSETHNKIMNIGDNAFLYATYTIKQAVEQGIEVDIHFVPTTINYKDLKIVYGVCIGLGVSKMSILRYVPQGRGKETSENNTELNLSMIQFLQLNRDMKYIRDLLKQRGVTQFRIGIPADFTFLIDYLEGNENPKKPIACTGGKTKILVKADGLVQVCPAWKELDHLSAGNIYEEDIVDIWKKGYTYEKFRELTIEDLVEPCKSCKFVDSCFGGCSAQRILASNLTIEDLKNAPDPLCFIDLIELMRIDKPANNLIEHDEKLCQN